MPLSGRRIPLVLLLALAVAGVTLLVSPDWPKALVTVITVPSGCTIIAADGVQWVSPATIPVPADGMPISVEHTGWLPAETVLYPVGGDTVTVNLEILFRFGVSSDPPGASVLINGEHAGITPCTLLVEKSGGYQLTLSLEDGILLRDSICIISGGDHSFHYQLPSVLDAGGIMPEMIRIPGGCYRTGESWSTITGTFLISRYEVTNSEFASFLNSVDPMAAADTLAPEGRTLLLDQIAPCNWYQPLTGTPREGYTVTGDYDDYPVTGISIDGMQAYCDWLNSSSGNGWVFRLPTRDEWTACASAGGNWPWPWGSVEPSGGMLNLSDSAESLMCRCPGLSDGYSGTSPVGSFPANDWGLFDMAGNVWEVCSDGTASGGSWLSGTSDCRIDASVTIDPGLGYAYIGFRPVADIPLQPPEGGTQ